MPVADLIAVGAPQGAMLGQGTAVPGSGAWAVWLWSGVLLVLVMLGAAAIVLIRRRLLDAEKGGPGAGLTIAELRAMRDRGELSGAEFERARSIVIAQSGGRASQPGADGPPGGRVGRGPSKSEPEPPAD